MSVRLTWAVLLLTACGPVAAQYKILDEGSGPAAVSRITHTIGSRYVFGLMDGQGAVSAINEASYTGRTTLTGGPEVVVYGTPDGDVFLQFTDALEFT